jgi:hypothetical protein
MDGKWKIALIFLVAWFKGYSQYIYTYTDPCTGILNSVTITQPSGSVTLFYAGQYNTFTAAQLQAGAFELWVQSVNASVPTGSNPCAGGGGTITTGSNAAIGTNTVNNVSGIVNIAAGLGGNIGSSAIPGGGVAGGGTSNTSNNDNGSNSSGGGSDDPGNGGDDPGSSSGSSGAGSSGGSGRPPSGSGGSGSGSGSSGSGSGGGSGGGSGTGGSGTSGGSGSGGSGQPGSGQGESGGGSIPSSGGGGSTEGGGTESGAVGGQENTTSASGGESESSSNGNGGGKSGGGQKQKSKQEKIGRGALIGSGDFVAIRNSSDIRDTGTDNFRFNTSLTHVNTKQNFIKGLNLNYTTGENVLNTTLYGSYKRKEFMGVFSNSVMTNFKTDWFNTTTGLAAQKLGPATVMLGSNYTVGQLGKSWFQNWSIVGGGFTNFKGGKSVGGNLMLLGVYSPYIFYYEGQWYKSGMLLVPLANLDFKLTDKFKWSISFSGAYQWNADILNYQLSTGTKMLL